MTSNWLKLGRRLSYPFSAIARRIRKRMKESYAYLFVMAIASIFTILGVVIQPLFASPFNWSNINLVNLEVVLSRFIYASPLIAFFVVIVIFIIKQIKKIDKEKDKKLVEAMKIAFKEALKDDREEERKDNIKKSGDW